MKRFVLALLILFAPAAWAQNAVTQNGAINTQRPAIWRADRQIGDSGGLLGQLNGPFMGRGLSPHSITDNFGLGQCSDTAPTTGPYDAFCFGHDADGNALLTVDSYGSVPKSLFVRKNGVLYEFPGTGDGDVLGPTPDPPSGHVALWNGGKHLKDGGLAYLHVDSVAALAGAAYTAYPDGVWRDIPNTSPLLYTASSSNCSLNLGAGDNGLQIAALGGGCFNAQVNPSDLDIRIWGCAVNQVTNDTACLATALATVSTLYSDTGGAALVVPATGKCAIAQLGPLGSNTVLRAATKASCLMSPANAGGPIIETPDAYTYMHRMLTARTDNTGGNTISVEETTNVASGDTVFVVADNGAVYTNTVNGTPTSTLITVNGGSWINGGVASTFTATGGSQWGSITHAGTAQGVIDGLTLDGNILNQPPVNNNVAAEQTVPNGALALASSSYDGKVRFSPGANLLLELYSSGNLSGITFTSRCTLSRTDTTLTQIVQTTAGPNNGIKRFGGGCNGFYSTAATGAGIVVGGAGYTSDDVGAVLTVLGGLCKTAPKFRIASLAGDAVNNVTLYETGGCATFPPGTVSVTCLRASGAPCDGSGVTLNPTSASDGITANASSASTVTIGVPDGVGSLDGIVYYGPMPRLRNITAQNFRGWPFRTAFSPGIGFHSPAPGLSGYTRNDASNWQTQEGYLENLQCLTAHAGCLWTNGPNDSRIKSVTGNFLYGIGVYFDHWSAGTVAEMLHISGGFPGDGTAHEPRIGGLFATDSISCYGCKFEEANENIVVLANNIVLDDTEVFHIDDGTSRTGIKLGDSNWVPANNLVKGYTIKGKCKNVALGCIRFEADGGAGLIEMTGYNTINTTVYAGTPWGCNQSGSPGTDISIKLLGASGGLTPLVRPAPCQPWTPVPAFAGSSAGITGTFTGTWVGSTAPFQLDFTNKGAPSAGDALTLSGLPWAPEGTCNVSVTYATNLTGLTGTLSAYMQGNNVLFRQSDATGNIDLTAAQINNNTSLWGTIGPCVKQ